MGRVSRLKKLPILATVKVSGVTTGDWQVTPTGDRTFIRRELPPTDVVIRFDPGSIKYLAMRAVRNKKRLASQWPFVAHVGTKRPGEEPIITIDDFSVS